MKHAGYFIGVGLLLSVLTSSSVAALVAGPAVVAPVVGDIHFERKTKGSDEFAPAIFPHWVHRVRFKCYVCHNKTVGFQMKAGSAAITMDAIEAGKYCGVCHKNKPAFGVSFETCNRCHRK